MEKNMGNPWNDISLSDYENHMALDSVWQLQAINQMMKGQLNEYDIQSVIILGIAGGNGLEHVDVEKITKIYGVDINAEYLATTRERYKNLAGTLECLCVDLNCETEKLPQANLLIANLIIEYIGYECFQKAVKAANPQYVSCVIQINTDDSFVSDSPYLHVFDGLERVYHHMAGQELQNSMKAIGYQLIQNFEYPLPNGKKLLQLDFANNYYALKLQEGSMMSERPVLNKEKITLCGDNCIECPRYNAHSEEELQKTAELWHRIGWRDCIVSNEEIKCEGCSSHKQCTYQLVECTKEHNVDKCNQCTEFPCEKIRSMLERSKEYQKRCKEVCTDAEYDMLEKAFFDKENNLRK